MKGALFALGIGLALCARAEAATCLGIGAPSGAGATAEIMDLVREAGKRAGLCIETMRAPKNRLHALALDGQILSEPEPPAAGSQIALPTPLATFEGTLYWLPTQPKPAGPQALIGVILGQDWALRAVAARGARPYEVRDNRQLMEMMAAGHLDGMMLPSISYRHFRPSYPALSDCRAEPLTPISVRLLLDARHRDLAGPLDEALASLRRDGTAQAIFERYAP